MSEEKVVVLSIFDTEEKADEAAAALKQWDKATEDIKLGGIGILVKDEDGKIKEHKVGPRRGKKGAGVGLVLGVVAAIPTGGLSLAAGAAGGLVGGGLVGSVFHKGFSELGEDDAARLSKELDIGHAVVGVLVAPTDTDAVSAELTRLGGRSETHKLSGEELEQADAATVTASSAPPETPGQTTAS